MPCTTHEAGIDELLVNLAIVHWYSPPLFGSGHGVPLAMTFPEPSRIHASICPTVTSPLPWAGTIAIPFNVARTNPDDQETTRHESAWISKPCQLSVVVGYA